MKHNCNSDICAIGFGGCGNNILSELHNNHESDISFFLISDSLSSVEAHDLPFSIYSSNEISTLLKQVSKYRLCFLIGGLGGNSCLHMPDLAKMLRSNGIMTVALVTMPFEFEKRTEKAEIVLEALRSATDALLVFSNEEAIKSQPSPAAMSMVLKQISKEMITCILAMDCSGKALIAIDIEDLRTFIHGLVIHKILTCKICDVILNKDAMNDLEAELLSEGRIGHAFLCLIFSAEVDGVKEIESCTKIVEKAASNNISLLFRVIQENTKEDLTIVLLMSRESSQ